MYTECSFFVVYLSERVKNMIQKKILLFHMIIIFVIGILFFLTGCGVQEAGPKKVRDLEVTVVAKENVPQELLQIIEEKKEAPFKFTFNNGEYLYICVGYGQQESGGYSISMDELYLAENAIYAKTCLIGPDPGVPNDGVCSYPYVVLKTEYLDYPVVFE